MTVITNIFISLVCNVYGTLCGTDDQIDDLKTALMVHESSYTIKTGLSAILITGAALTVVQVISSTRFAVHLKEVFEEMKSSMNKDHVDNEKCSEILDKTIAATIVVKTSGVGLSIAAMIPGAGLALLCQNTTTRDCIYR